MECCYGSRLLLPCVGFITFLFSPYPSPHRKDKNPLFSEVVTQPYGLYCCCGLLFAEY